MEDFITIAKFDNAFDVKLSIAKGLLEEAGIDYFVANEHYRAAKPAFAAISSDLMIELRVDAEKIDEAVALFDAIENE